MPFVTAEQRVEVWEDDLVVRLNAKVATALHSSKNAEHALATGPMRTSACRVNPNVGTSLGNQTSSQTRALKF
ncbi:MAG: hypothetical protein R3E42_15135 [Burkholderiaceae bacterium]